MMSKISKTSQSRINLIAYACLFASGMATLVYELIWFRYLTLIFGATLYALSAVLCAFMLGLAGGAWGMGRILAKGNGSKRLILWYGIFEGLIGLYALSFPLGLELLEKIYPLVLPADGQAGLGLHIMEFLLGTLLMLPATLLMGATLPLVSCWAVGDERRQVFSTVSLLYGWNTMGAVFGCLFTQFFAIQLWGVQGAIRFGVLLNVLVFLVCFVCGRIFYQVEPPSSSVKQENNSSTTDEDTGSINLLIFVMFAYSGMASLSSEILWTRILVFPMGTTLFSFALILATFLSGIALGSLVARRLLGESNWILKFILIEISIGLVCIGILPLLENLTEWTSLADQFFYSIENSQEKTLFIRFLFAFGLMFIPTFGFGLLFPLANHIYSFRLQAVSKSIGNVYSINTLGGVLGTILTTFVFIPLFGIRLSIYLIYAVLILFGVFALAKYRKQNPVLISALVLVVLIVGKTVFVPQIETGKSGVHNLARLEINVPEERIKLLDYKEGEFSTISVVEDTESGARTIYLDGFSTATVSRSFSGSTYMQAMGFVPMVLHPEPKNVLVIGFGTGNTLGIASLFPNANVHGVEIDKNVLKFSKWFSDWNHDVLKRPNTKMFIQDGRAFLRWSKTRYDVIIMEPMSPLQAGVVNLYSKEFYELALDHLEEDGILVQWLPLHLVGREDARSITQTFNNVFPESSVWNSFLTRIVLLVGSREKVNIDRKLFDTKLKNPELKKVAEEMKVMSFLDFADFFITDGNRLSAFLANAGEISDDRPILEFSTVSLLPPLKWETDEVFLNMLRHRINQSPPVTGMTLQEREVFDRDFKLRTAQRLAVFSRRYQGPGAEAFARRNYFSGLEEMNIYFDSFSKPQVHLDAAQWQR
ncbi:MAG: spermidine synthase [Nitrospinales bacterium]|jgi:spermidine synthase